MLSVDQSKGFMYQVGQFDPRLIAQVFLVFTDIAYTISHK